MASAPAPRYGSQRTIAPRYFDVPPVMATFLFLPIAAAAPTTAATTTTAWPWRRGCMHGSASSAATACPWRRDCPHGSAPGRSEARESMIAMHSRHSALLAPAKSGPAGDARRNLPVAHSLARCGGGGRPAVDLPATHRTSAHLPRHLAGWRRGGGGRPAVDLPATHRASAHRPRHLAGSQVLAHTGPVVVSERMVRIWHRLAV